MMENLFGVSGMDNREKKKTTVLESRPKFIQIIDSRKAQNLSILLKALNVTTPEVISALKQGLYLCSSVYTIISWCLGAYINEVYLSSPLVDAVLPPFPVFICSFNNFILLFWFYLSTT